MIIVLFLLFIGASTADDDWIAVQRGEFIDYDLEKSPLQIRTDSLVGSNEYVKENFYSAEGDRAGSVYFSFTSTPQYWLGWCSTSWTDFPTALPNEVDKTWTITLTRTSGTAGVIVRSNDKEVLNVVMSDATCSYSDWSTFWSREVRKIMFLKGADTASDYYRPGPVRELKDMGCVDSWAVLHLAEFYNKEIVAELLEDLGDRWKLLDEFVGHTADDVLIDYLSKHHCSPETPALDGSGKVKYVNCPHRWEILGTSGFYNKEVTKEMVTDLKERWNLLAKLSKQYVIKIGDDFVDYLSKNHCDQKYISPQQDKKKEKKQDKKQEQN